MFQIFFFKLTKTFADFEELFCLQQTFQVLNNCHLKNFCSSANFFQDFRECSSVAYGKYGKYKVDLPFRRFIDLRIFHCNFIIIFTRI